VFYPSGPDIVSALARDFELIDSCGIGLTVPPSYVSFFTEWEIERLSAMDELLAHKPVFRKLADHQLYIFRHK
jgi:hypothetical protein